MKIGCSRRKVVSGTVPGCSSSSSTGTHVVEEELEEDRLVLHVACSASVGGAFKMCTCK